MKLPGFIRRHVSTGSTHLQANLRDETLKFKVIIDSISDGVILIDDHHNIQLINPGATAICGWTAADSMGIDISLVIPLVNSKGEPLTGADDPFKQVFSTGENIRPNNLFMMTRDKQQIPISLNLSPLLDDKKVVTAAVAVLSNVTKERAEEKQRADFISTASHEMRTPVAAIEGYLALALNDKVATIDSRARNYLEKAHSSTQHLGKLFQDLLTSAKAEDGRLTSHPVILELGEFLEQITSDLRLIAENKGLYMDFLAGTNTTINATASTGGEHVIKPLYYVNVDPDRLREVITNLFDNAVKYTAEGRISIGLTGNDQLVQCYIKDTGHGIPADDLPHLFQKFYRVDSSATRSVGGTGLGLFICRKIIELYNGRIWAESTIDVGTTFYINLPRISSDKAKQLKLAEENNTLVKPVS
ncbi:MAG: hypothetical protein NVS1B10_00050 [Candidatus Saccharimonadales bacterium]